jgi:hypothetical protein
MPALRAPSGLHPFLFAAYAVLFLYSENLTEVTFRDAIPPLGRAIIGAGLATIVAAILLRDLRRGAIVGSALVAVFYGYGHLKTILEDAGHGTDALHATLIGLVLVAVVLAIFLRRERIAALTSGLDLVAIILVALTLVSIVPYEFGRAAYAGAAVPGRGQPVPGDRDIYWLVFDRYGSEDGIRRFTGVDNDLPEWLRERGFHVADASYSNYVRTTLSLATAIRMDYLTDIAARQPESEDLTPAYRIIEEHAVARTLRERGYRYIHVGSWFGPTRTHPLADLSPDIETETDFVSVLDETTIMPLFRELRGKGEEIKPTDLIHRERGLFQFKMLDEVRFLPGPKFVMAHVLLPHMPYVFDPDGVYPSQEDRERPEPERFADQLTYTNTRIRELVTSLLDVPEDQRPIIIIQADEGMAPAPYAADLGFDWATATSDDLHIKYGIISAFYLPIGEGPLPDAIGPVNTFRLVFSRAFGMDLPLLPERSWTSERWERPWELTEVTDRLAQP